MEKCLWGSRTAPRGGTTQGSLAFGCVTVLLQLCTERSKCHSTEKMLWKHLSEAKKKHHRRTFLPLKGPSPSLRDWDKVRCLCYRERGAALPEGWNSRNILQDKHGASQKICLPNTCVTHTGLFCNTHPIQCLLKAGEPVFSGHGIICEVNSVWDIGGGVFQQWQVNKWSLQSVHFQHVKLGEKGKRWIRTHSEMNSRWIKLAQAAEVQPQLRLTDLQTIIGHHK